MTPRIVPVEFERTMGCTAAELIAWLPTALPGAHIVPGAPSDAGSGSAVAVFPDGRLTLAWQTLPERRIALLRIPCLRVGFAYAGLDEPRRQQVQRHFDLATQRGGG